VHQFTLKHAVRIKSASYRKRVRKHILTSGLSSELNVDEFIGLQILWGVMFPAFLYVMNFALALDLPTVLLVGMGMGGFVFPQMHAGAEKKRREISVRGDLPFF